ncbi:hypothetical protein GCM10023324_49360 [Streptomyces youssoufiensis]
MGGTVGLVGAVRWRRFGSLYGVMAPLERQSVGGQAPPRPSRARPEAGRSAAPVARHGPHGASVVICANLAAPPRCPPRSPPGPRRGARWRDGQTRTPGRTPPREDPPGQTPPREGPPRRGGAGQADSPAPLVRGAGR